jgi:hypothetical protein
MTELWDNPRPVGYWPGTPSQWREPTVDDCTWYATEFAFSTDTEGGTPVSVAIRDTQDLWPERERVFSQYGAYKREYITRLLTEGAVFVVGGDYEKLPKHYRRWTYNDYFNHAMAIKTYDAKHDRTFLYDPLGGGRTYEPYDGEWISMSAILHYTWQANSTKWYAGLVQNLGDEPMKAVFVNPTHPADREVRVEANTVVRGQPRSTGERTRQIYSATKWWPVLGRTTDGWRLIAWNLDLSNKNIGYVHVNDIIEARAVAPPYSDTDCKDLEEANAMLLKSTASLQELVRTQENKIEDQQERIDNAIALLEIG